MVGHLHKSTRRGQSSLALIDLSSTPVILIKSSYTAIEMLQVDHQFSTWLVLCWFGRYCMVSLNIFGIIVVPKINSRFRFIAEESTLLFVELL